MAKNILNFLRGCFHRKVSESKEIFESKMYKPPKFCTITQEEYNRFVKISKQNDKFAK